VPRPVLPPRARAGLEQQPRRAHRAAQRGEVERREPFALVVREARLPVGSLAEAGVEGVHVVLDGVRDDRVVPSELLAQRVGLALRVAVGRRRRRVTPRAAVEAEEVLHRAGEVGGLGLTRPHLEVGEGRRLLLLIGQVEAVPLAVA